MAGTLRGGHMVPREVQPLLGTVPANPLPIPVSVNEELSQRALQVNVKARQMHFVV